MEAHLDERLLQFDKKIIKYTTMDIRHSYVKDVLSVDQEDKASEGQNFSLHRMIRSFGEWTLGRIHLSLQNTRSIPCGKKHDEEQRMYEYCEHFGHNLVCGHTMSTQSVSMNPLRTASGLIATSAYVVDHFGEPISKEYIPRLEEFGMRSWKIDGAAYAAFDGLREHGLGKRWLNIPDAFRQPELEKIRDIEVLRAAIRAQELAIAPEIENIRNEVVAHYEKVLGL